MTTPNPGNDVSGHVCAKHAICFQCFKAGMDKARARRQAWAQRSLPFEAPPPTLSPRAVAHRRQMLDHLSRLSQRA